MNEAKPFVIDKRLVWEAYHKVKENKGCLLAMWCRPRPRNPPRQRSSAEEKQSKDGEKFISFGMIVPLLGKDGTAKEVELCNEHRRLRF